MDLPARPSQQIQMELFPGDRIVGKRSGEYSCFLFSGSIINLEQGITVAHALDDQSDIDIQLQFDSARSVHDRIVGKCRKTFENLQRQGGGRLTADLALLKLNTTRCSVGNTVWWPFRGENTAFQIRIYRGQEIPADTEVIILDRNGHFQSGYIRSTHLTDVRIEALEGGMHNVLGICAENNTDASADTQNNIVAVTDKGDSGALVMSVPSGQSNVLYVYGIVVGTYKFGENESESFTVANSLFEVIDEISQHLLPVGYAHDIDFA